MTSLDSLFQDYRLEPGSFQDRESRVFYIQGEIYRVLSPTAKKNWDQLSQCRFYKAYTQAGKIIETAEVPPSPLQHHLPGILEDQPESSVLKHQSISWISYPYEWPFGMLKDAALLQLELLQAALEEEMILKDATAYNIQWNGSLPVFIDIPSFESLKPGSPWVGYQQFCRLFLLPLFLQAYKQTSFHPWLRGAIQGIDPVDFKSLLSFRDLFRPGILKHAYLHGLLQENALKTTIDLKNNPEAQDFNLHALHYPKASIQKNIANLQQIIQGLSWNKPQSHWSGYAQNTSYPSHDIRDKENFVEQAIRAKPREMVWDFGCNTGQYAKIAARYSRYVVAFDSDHAAVERFYQELKAGSQKNILPLLMNIADASPSLGWQCRERKSLMERPKPDLILNLALIHHLVLSHNIPMSEYLGWLRSFNAEIVIEFVNQDDPMALQLLKNKVNNFTHYTRPYFEECLLKGFSIQNKLELKDGLRTLYHATPKPAVLSVLEL